MSLLAHHLCEVRIHILGEASKLDFITWQFRWRSQCFASQVFVCLHNVPQISLLLGKSLSGLPKALQSKYLLLKFVVDRCLQRRKSFSDSFAEQVTEVALKIRRPALLFWYFKPRILTEESGFGFFSVEGGSRLWIAVANHMPAEAFAGDSISLFNCLNNLN